MSAKSNFEHCTQKFVRPENLTQQQWPNFALLIIINKQNKSYLPSLVASFTGFAAAKLSVTNSKISFHTSMMILEQRKKVTSHDDKLSSLYVKHC